MFKAFYNCEEFNKIFDFYSTDPYRSLRLMERYVDKYPTDYSAYTYYAGILIKLGKLDEAENLVNTIMKKARADVSFCHHVEKYRKLEINASFVGVKLASYRKQYKKCYDLIQKYKKDFYKENIVLDRVEFFCASRLNMDIKAEDDTFYLDNQIVNYSEDAFMEHIRKHMEDTCYYDSDEKACIFNNNFDIEKIVNEVKKYIPSDKKILNGIIDCVYFFKYDRCGTCDGTPCDFFKVITLADTGEFITMFPISFGEKLPYVDLNYLKELTSSNSKVKKKSRIDIFNERLSKSLAN